MANLNELSAGQSWAYRRREQDQLVEVHVLPLAISRHLACTSLSGVACLPVLKSGCLPVASRCYGQIVPPFSEAEANWSALSSFPDEVEADALLAALDLLFQGMVEIGGDKLTRGTISIFSASHVDETIGGDWPL